MPTAPTLYLCGAGNVEGVRLAVSVNRHQRRWSRVVLLDDDPAKHGQSIVGVEVAGPFDLLSEVSPDAGKVVNLVARTAPRRRAARERIAGFGVPFAPLIHSSVDTSGVEFGSDVVVYQNAILGAHSALGEGSIVFMAAIVGHGARLGECCVVAPNAVINARVDVGDDVYIGTNASILPDLKIGAGATVGACTAAMQDVPAGATILGVPGRVLFAQRSRTKRPRQAEAATSLPAEAAPSP